MACHIPSEVGVLHMRSAELLGGLHVAGCGEVRQMFWHK